MSRYWAVLPVIVIASIPIWDDPSEIVIAIAGAAAIVCVFGLLLRLLALVTAGAVIGTIGYAAADSAGGADVVAAAAFGLALLALLDMSEFARRTRGAGVADGVLRDQVAFWFARAAITAAAIAALLVCSAALVAVLPAPARAVVAGAGAVIAFAGALRGGIGRRES